jgi:hypothetical protein
MRDKAVNTWGASRFIQQPYEFFFGFFLERYRACESQNGTSKEQGVDTHSPDKRW